MARPGTLTVWLVRTKEGATSDPTNRPWDDPRTENELMEWVMRRPRARYDRLTPEDQPGAYMFFAAGAVETLGPLGTACFPVYVGSASDSLKERLSRYGRSLWGIEGLDSEHLWVLTVPCRSHAGAVWCEAVLMEELRPFFNGKGFGSKMPGSRRALQRCSVFDGIFPGRKWAREVPLNVQADARLQLVNYLATLMPAEPRWSPIMPSRLTSPPAKAQPSPSALALLQGGSAPASPSRQKRSR